MRTSWRVACVTILVATGCHFGFTPEVYQKKLERSMAFDDRAAAVKRGDWEAVVASDDLIITHTPHDVPILRSQRQEHFAKLVDASATGEGDAMARFAKLIALRREAKRTDLDTSRVADLATVDVAAIAPKLTALSPELWAIVEAKYAAKEGAAALDLATAIAAEIPEDADKLAMVQAAVSGFHLEIAELAARSGHYGAQVMHARLAKLFGGDPGDLAISPPELVAQTDFDWTIIAEGACAETLGVRERLVTEGYPSGQGQPVRLTVTLDDCTPSTKVWQDTETVPYQIIQQIEIRKPVMVSHCTADKTTKDEKRDVFSDRVEITTTYTTEKGSCWEEDTGETYVDHVEEMLVDESASVELSHHVDTMHASGTIRLESDSGTQEQRFDVTGESFDEMTRGAGLPEGAQGVEPLPSYDAGQNEEVARSRTASLVRERVGDLTRQFVAERVAGYIEQGKAAGAGGPSLVADDAFFIASQLLRNSNEVPAELQDWMIRVYHVPATYLTAALRGDAFPMTPIAGDDEKIVATTAFSSDPAVQTFRSILTLTLTGGVTRATPEGDADALSGGGAAFHVNVLGFGFRMNGGYDGDNGLVDFDFYGGYGGWLGNLHVHPVWGFGLDFSPANQEFDPPSAGVMKLPVAPYAELGARVAYAFKSLFKFDVMYTKAFRASYVVPEQKRLEARVLLSKVALQVRYSEYMFDSDGLNPLFGTDHRVARMLSLYAGFGFF